MQPFAGNYKNDKSYAKSNWLCKCNRELETEQHLTSGICSVYRDINAKYDDLSDEANLVGFFSEVLARRSDMEDQEEDTMVADGATECMLVSQEEEGGRQANLGCSNQLIVDRFR